MAFVIVKTGKTGKTPKGQTGHCDEVTQSMFRKLIWIVYQPSEISICAILLDSPPFQFSNNGVPWSSSISARVSARRGKFLPSVCLRQGQQFESESSPCAEDRLCSWVANGCLSGRATRTTTEGVGPTGEQNKNQERSGIKFTSEGISKNPTLFQVCVCV